MVNEEPNKNSLLFYFPVFVVWFSIMGLGFFLLRVFPTFEEVYKSFGHELPPLTALFLPTSQFLQHFWFLILPFITAALFSFEFFSNGVIRKNQRPLFIVGGLVYGIFTIAMFQPMFALSEIIK